MVKCDDFKWPGCSYETPSDTLELEGSLLEGLVRFQQATVRDSQLKELHNGLCAKADSSSVWYFSVSS